LTHSVEAIIIDALVKTTDVENVSEKIKTVKNVAVGEVSQSATVSLEVGRCESS